MFCNRNRPFQIYINIIAILNPCIIDQNISLSDFHDFIYELFINGSVLFDLLSDFRIRAFVSDIQTEMSIFRMLDRGYIFIKSIDFMIFFQEKFCTALPDPGCCACDQDFHQAKFSFILLRNAVIRTAATAIHRTLSM